MTTVLFWTLSWTVRYRHRFSTVVAALSADGQLRDGQASRQLVHMLYEVVLQDLACQG